MTEKLSNTLIVGLMGSGKGILVSNALRAAKKKFPKLKIFVIGPKCDEKENGYFDGVANILKRFRCENQPDEIVINWVTECFDEYYKFSEQNEQTLLFLDEGFAVGEACSRQRNSIIQSKISNFSLADSRGKNFWLASTAPFVKGLGLNLSASTNLVVIGLIRENNLGILKQWSRSTLIPGLTILSQFFIGE